MSDTAAQSHKYRSASRLAKAIAVLLSVEVALCLGRLSITILIDPGAVANLLSPEVEATETAGLLSLFNLLSHLNFYATGILFVIWLHRVFCNLRSLGVEGVQAKSWQCIWSFLIPFYNLYKPWQIVAEVWIASAPNNLDPVNWKSEKISSLVTAWWWLYLIGSVSGKLARSADKLCQPMSDTARLLYIADDTITTIAAVLCIRLVLHLTRRQELKAVRMPTKDSSSAPEQMDER